MKLPTRWYSVLIIAGSILMLFGTLDPLEGSVLITLGSGLVAAGVFLRRSARRIILYWVSVFLLIAAGVGAMFALSSVGGIGGASGHSMWWGMWMLPYPVGWLMALIGAVIGLMRFFKARHAAHA